MLSSQTFKDIFTHETFHNTYVITAKLGNIQPAMSNPEKALKQTVNRREKGFLKTTVRACSHGVHNAHRSVNFMHNFDITKDWYYSHDHLSCGCTPKRKTAQTHASGTVEQDELATVATLYVQRLVPYIAEKRHCPTDNYSTCLPTDTAQPYPPGLTDAYDPTQQETTHHHGASLGAACPAAAQKVPEFHSGALKLQQECQQQFQRENACKAYSAGAERYLQAIQSQQWCATPRSATQQDLLPELKDLRAHASKEEYKSKRGVKKTNKTNKHDQQDRTTPVLVTIGQTTTTIDQDHSFEVRKDNDIICKIYKPQPTTTDNVQSFPTESAIKAKAKRNKVKAEQGISCNQQQKTNKVNKHVQEHYDDCGSDFTPLQNTLTNTKSTDLYANFDEFYDSQHKFHTSYDLQSLYGPYCTTHEALPTTTIKHNNAKEHFICLQVANDTYHSMELQLEINHCIDDQYRILSRHGTSYYTVDHATTHSGMIPDATVHYLQEIITEFPPSILVLSTTKGFDTTLYNTINTQYNNGYDYVLFIQPNNTTIDSRWLALRQTHSAKVYYNQQLVALSSSDELINDLERTQPLVQPNNIWSPTMASTISQSITNHILSYPTASTDTTDLQDKPNTTPATKGRGKGKRKRQLPPDSTPIETTERVQPQRTPTPYDNCPACKGNQSKYDERHTRIPGECKYPHIETPTWTCPGCINKEGRWTKNHTYIPGECKHFDQQTRMPHTKARTRYPAPPVQKVTSEPTAGLRANNPDGELGQADAEQAVAQQSADTPSSSSTSAPHVPRGPDTYQRERRTYQEASTGETATDWSKFDVHLTTKALRTADDAGRRRLLRKLHLRWWHATAAQMKTVLKAAN